MTKTLARAYEWLLDFCGLVAGVAIGLMALFITIDVVIRNLGIGNFPWLLEVAEYTLYGTTFLAAPWALRLGAHVRVDLLLQWVPPRAGRALEATVDILGAAIAAVLTYYGLLVTLDSHGLDARIVKELVVVEWPLLAIVPFSCGLLAIEFLRRLGRTIAGADANAGAAAPTDGL